MKQYLIIGNGVAGTTAAENIRKLDRDGAITILTDEPLPFYWRTKLNDFISGETDEAALIAKKESWYEENAVDLRLNTRVTGADAGRRRVLTGDDNEFSYDVLLLATGSHSFVPPIKGSDKQGVFALRSIRDAREILGWAEAREKAVLIGGGLLGLETGKALRKLGKKVTVVEFFPRLLPRQLDENGAKRLQGIMEEMGFSFRLGARTEEITGETRVNGVRLEGGETLSAEMVIISAGVRPNLDLAAPLGLMTDKGVKVDERLQTNVPGVFAAGDVAEFKGIPYGIWPAALEQGKIAGINMAGGEARYEGTTMANTLKVVGIDLASAGDIDAEDKRESRIVQDDRIYRKIVLDKGRIIGCIMLGNTTGFHRVTRMMAEKRDVSRMVDQILEP